MRGQKLQRFFGVLALGLWTAAAITAPLTAGKAEAKQYTVVLDPGHGGEDGGAVAADGTLEKEINLEISLLLKEKLEQGGIEVIMTRTEDDDTDGLSGFHKRQDLEARAKIGNESEADLYISIHINASTSSKDQGFQIWYGSGNPSGKEIAEHMTKIVEEKEICTRIRVVKQVPNTLYVFRTVTIPSLLVECGFLSNATDLYKLRQEEFRTQLCDALCEGVLSYLSGKSSDIM